MSWYYMCTVYYLPEKNELIRTNGHPLNKYFDIHINNRYNLNFAISYISTITPYKRGSSQIYNNFNSTLESLYLSTE